MKKHIFLLISIFFAITSFCQEKIVTADLNLRKSPEITDNKICIIPKGSPVIIIQDLSQTEWVKVQYGEHIGYVYKSYVANSNDYHKITQKVNAGKKYYTNSSGERVQSPTRYNAPPAGATAECNDGTYSFSHSRRGTCSHHGGVKRWL